MLRCINSLLHLADFFGRTYSFESDYSQTFKTSIGGLISILLIISVSIIGFFFGKDIYERKMPITASSQAFLSPADTQISLTEIPLIITFHRNGGLPLLNYDKIFQMEMQILNVFQNATTSTKAYPGFIECDSNNYGINQDYVNKTVSNLIQQGLSPKCLNYKNDLYFQNDYSANNSTALHFRFKICNNQKNKNCLPYSQVTNPSNRYFIKLTYLNSYYDPMNYSNPFSYYEDALTQQVSTSFSKRNFLRFAKNILDTDLGWIFENIQTATYISLKSIYSDVNPISDDIIYIITLESPKVVSKSTRSYLKAQELLAKIGGLFNGCYIIIMSIIYYYVKIEYYIQLFHKTIKLQEEKVNKTPKISHVYKFATNNIIRNDIQLNNNKIADASGLELKLPKLPEKSKSEIEPIKSDVSSFKLLLNKILPFVYQDDRVKFNALEKYLTAILPIESYIAIHNKSNQEQEDKSEKKIVP